MESLERVTLAGGTLSGARVGSGPDLVVIHSLLADRTAFDPVLPWLASRFRVTLVNLPGFHGSAVIAPGIEGYADRIASVFDSERLSPDTIVVANGFGGTVATAMAIRHGDKFGRLVISDAAAGFPPEGRKAFEVMATKVEAEGIGSVAMISANRVFHKAYLDARPGAVEERRKVLLGVAPEAFIAACRTLMQTDLVAQLPAIVNPTLVLCGELDAATPPLLCRQLAQHIPGARYIELPGCGHCPPLEQPDAFIGAIADFVA
ncbi:MAG: alpha/beta fold hydrolase [Beijerinckiaceae bacterium]